MRIRSHFQSRRFGWLLVLTLGLSAVAAQAQEFRYRYVSLDEVVPPAPFTAFFATSLQDSGRVYGIVCGDLNTCSDGHVAFFKDGTVTVLQLDSLVRLTQAARLEVPFLSIPST